MRATSLPRGVGDNVPDIPTSETNATAANSLDGATNQSEETVQPAQARFTASGRQVKSIKRLIEEI